MRDLKDKNIQTKIRLRVTGATHGGIPFERGSLFYLLRNRFYIGEVKYKGEILPGGAAADHGKAAFLCRSAEAHRSMVSPKSRQNQIRLSPDGAAV